MNTQDPTRPTRKALATGEEGIALLTVILVMLIITLIGVGAITVTGLENRMAGFSYSTESAVAAAESCVGTGVNVIQQTLQAGRLPPAYSPNPVTAANAGDYGLLQQEIIGQSNNDGDSVTVSPDTTVTVNGYQIDGDIDRLYVQPLKGSNLAFGNAYDQTGGGSVYVYYRIDCRAINQTTGTTNRIVAVYACLITGESCQKQI